MFMPFNNFDGVIVKKTILSIYLMTSAFSALASINEGDRVMESFKNSSIKSVKKVINNLYLLSDNEWYVKEYLHELVNEYKGIKVGDKVVTSELSQDVLTVSAISNGLYILSNNGMYPEVFSYSESGTLNKISKDLLKDSPVIVKQIPQSNK